MMHRLLLKAAIALPLTLAVLTGSAPMASAQSAKGMSGLPLPRFVSLKSRRVNLRVGPSTDYATSWMYTKAGLPVEIIQEYDNWRRIRDADGTEGWVNHALLSGERTAIAAPWMRGKGEAVYVNMRRDPLPSSSVIAKLEPGVVFRVKECTGDWCHVDATGTEGWVAQSEVWGAYPGEAFK